MNAWLVHMLKCYQLLKEIGGGVSSRVHVVRRIADSKLLVMKILLVGEGLPVSRAEQEASIHTELSSEASPHPWIPSVVETFQEAGRFFIVMQYVPGWNLGDRLAIVKVPLIELCHQLLRIVAELHERGIVHLDLKPENLIYQPKANRLYLIDFGFAHRRGTESGIQRSLGTLDYVSPEILDRRSFPLSFERLMKSDVWSLGATLYTLVHGQAPFYDDCHERTKRNIYEGRRPPSSGPDPLLNRLIDWALTRDVSARPLAADLLAACRAPAEK